jgi:apolipoprotein D and lipocalin family protein
MKASTAIALALLAAAASAEGSRRPFQEVVSRMELESFLGSWYVVALMPTPFEKGAANGIETYSLDAKGDIRVEYVFYKGGPSGKRTVMHQKGWVVDKATNTEWKVQPLWPFKMPYLIIDLAEDYRYAVIGTDNYKYVWIMSRTPTISDQDYAGILGRLGARGYDVGKVQRMVQAW